METGEYFAIGMFVSFIILLFTGFPVAWILAGISIIFTALAMLSDTYFDTWNGLDWGYLSIIVDRLWGVMNNWVMVALPMFVFMGQMLDRSGVADQLMENMLRLFGKIRGGLALTVAFIGILLAASTGIVGASVVLLGVLSLPIMIQHKYDKRLAAGTICSVGTLGILIPPSIMLVVMADQLAVPVGDLFMGALMPGLLLGIMYITYIVLTAYLRPESAPLPTNPEPVTLRVVLSALKSVLPPAILILAVLGSIFFGIATPTEAAGVGAMGATILATIYKKINASVVRKVCIETSKTTAFVFAVIVGATAFSLVLRGLGGDELIENALNGLPFGPTGIIISILVVTFLLGFFLEWIEITLIVLPLVSPVVIGLGYDIVWFTILFAVCLQTSFLTPPVGFALFYLKGAAQRLVSIIDIYKGVIPFILIQVLGLVLVFIFEDIVLWLPDVMYKQ